MLSAKTRATLQVCADPTDDTVTKLAKALKLSLPQAEARLRRAELRGLVDLSGGINRARLTARGKERLTNG